MTAPSTRVAPHADMPGCCPECGWHWATEGTCSHCGAQIKLDEPGVRVIDGRRLYSAAWLDGGKRP